MSRSLATLAALALERVDPLRRAVGGDDRDPAEVRRDIQTALQAGGGKVEIVLEQGRGMVRAIERVAMANSSLELRAAWLRRAAMFASIFLAGATGAARVLLAMMVVAASLEAFAGICLGCKAFAALMRLGVVPDSVCEACVVPQRATTGS